MQIGNNLLTSTQESATIEYKISTKYDILIYWLSMLDDLGLFVANFYNIGVSDKWGRLEAYWELVTSSLFVITAK